MFEVQWSAGDRTWLPYNEIAHLKALADYLEAIGVDGIEKLTDTGDGGISEDDPQVFIGHLAPHTKNLGRPDPLLLTAEDLLVLVIPLAIITSLAVVTLPTAARPHTVHCKPLDRLDTTIVITYRRRQDPVYRVEALLVVLHLGHIGRDDKTIILARGRPSNHVDPLNRIAPIRRYPIPFAGPSKNQTDDDALQSFWSIANKPVPSSSTTKRCVVIARILPTSQLVIISFEKHTAAIPNSNLGSPMWSLGKMAPCT